MEESITLPRLVALREYWRKVPPASVAFAASHGLLREGRSTAVAVQSKPIRGKELFEWIKGSGGTISG